MKDEHKELLFEMTKLILVGAAAFFIGMGMNNAEVQKDCNNFIQEEILTDNVMNCLKGVDENLLMPDFNDLNITYNPNLLGNKTTESETT